MQAVKAGRVVIVDGNQMFARPGPRLVDALEFLVGLLHNKPELIPDGFPWAHWPAEGDTEPPKTSNGSLSKSDNTNKPSTGIRVAGSAAGGCAEQPNPAKGVSAASIEAGNVVNGVSASTGGFNSVADEMAAGPKGAADTESGGIAGKALDQGHSSGNAAVGNGAGTADAAFDKKARAQQAGNNQCTCTTALKQLLGCCVETKRLAYSTLAICAELASVNTPVDTT